MGKKCFWIIAVSWNLSWKFNNKKPSVGTTISSWFAFWLYLSACISLFCMNVKKKSSQHFFFIGEGVKKKSAGAIEVDDSINVLRNKSHRLTKLNNYWNWIHLVEKILFECCVAICLFPGIWLPSTFIRNQQFWMNLSISIEADQTIVDSE